MTRDDFSLVYRPAPIVFLLSAALWVMIGAIAGWACGWF